MTKGLFFEQLVQNDLKNDSKMETYVFTTNLFIDPEQLFQNYTDRGRCYFFKTTNGALLEVNGLDENGKQKRFELGTHHGLKFIAYNL